VRILIPRYSDVELDDIALADIYRFPTDRRWVRANFISTVDGAAQGPDHKSGSLSGPADRRVLALLRALCDVVLVGATTARVEGYRPADIRPEFAPIRAALGMPATPPIAIVTHSLDVPEALLDDPRTMVVTSADTDAERRARLAERVDVIVAGTQRVDAAAALDALEERGHSRILCEGGPTFFAFLARAGLIDELCLTISPALEAGFAPRIANGLELAEPTRLQLATLLEDQGFLFTRYLVTR
jgi:riboflavin biosynthesis pyrimidine reductase